MAEHLLNDLHIRAGRDGQARGRVAQFLNHRQVHELADACGNEYRAAGLTASRPSDTAYANTIKKQF